MKKTNYNKLISKLCVFALVVSILSTVLIFSACGENGNNGAKREYAVLIAPHSFLQTSTGVSWAQSVHSYGTRIYLLREDEDELFIVQIDSPASSIGFAALGLDVGGNTLRFVSLGGRELYENGVTTVFINSEKSTFRVNAPMPVYTLITPVYFILTEGGGISWTRDFFCNRVRIYILRAGASSFEFLSEGNFSSISMLSLNLVDGINILGVRSMGGDRTEYILGREHQILSSETAHFQFNKPVTVLNTPKDFVLGPRNILWTGDINSYSNAVYIKRAGSEIFEYVMSTPHWFVPVADLKLLEGENVLRVMSLAGNPRFIDNELFFFENSGYGEIEFSITTDTRRLITPHEIRLNEFGYEVLWIEDVFASGPRVYIKRPNMSHFEHIKSNLTGEIDIMSLRLEKGTNVFRVKNYGGMTALIDGVLIEFLDSDFGYFYIEVESVTKRPLLAPSRLFRVTVHPFGQVLMWDHEGDSDYSIVYIKRAGLDRFERVYVDLNFVPLNYLNLHIGENILRVASVGGHQEIIDGVLYIRENSAYAYFIVYVDQNGSISIK